MPETMHLFPEEREALKQEIFSSLHCALPGEVVEYYADEGTADIQPTIRTRSGIQLPILRNVPVFYWGRYNFNPREGELTPFPSFSDIFCFFLGFSLVSCGKTAYNMAKRAHTYAHK